MATITSPCCNPASDAPLPLTTDRIINGADGVVVAVVGVWNSMPRKPCFGGCPSIIAIGPFRVVGCHKVGNANQQIASEASNATTTPPRILQNFLLMGD